MSAVRVAVAGNFHWNAGYSQTVAGYIAAAADVGCEVAVAAPLSRVDDEVPRHLPMVDDVGWATHLVFMFEARQYVTERHLELAAAVPRHRRAVIDLDGRWAPVPSGEDDGSESSTESWRQVFRELSDLVLLPKAAGQLPEGATFFKCFGLPRELRRPSESAPAEYDLQYIGNNWWRWDALAQVVEAACSADGVFRRVRVCGRWWDGERCPGFEAATMGKQGWLRERGVEITPPVPFGQVVAEMGRAAISPLLVRPLVRETSLLTPRMFETLASGSVPALPAAASFVASVYGDGADQLLLGSDPATTLGRMLAERSHYARVVGAIQDRTASQYSYPRVLTELLELLG